jgi:phosphoribosylanthranilate isomerase
VLLDAFDDKMYGGTGKCFDWGLLSKVKNKKVFLSGGLNPSNVGEAAKLGAYAIDTSSGIEKKKGKKDSKKMKELFERAK